MVQYSETTVYISSYAKLPVDMPSGGTYGSLDVGMVINYETDTIEDVSITLLTDESKDFLKQLIVGCRFGENDLEEVIAKVKNRFLGMSQKAFCVNVKLIHEKYIRFKVETAKLG